MEWRKITLVNEQIVHGILDAILVELQSIDKSLSLLPGGFCVFAGRAPDEETLCLYFSPPAVPYIAELTSRYCGVPCEKPLKKDIESLLFGYGDSCWALLDS